MTKKEWKKFLGKLEESTEKLLEAEQCPDCGENLRYEEITDVYGDTYWVGFCNCQHEIEDNDEIPF
jgi:hypothetical protein